MLKGKNKKRLIIEIAPPGTNKVILYLKQIMTLWHQIQSLIWRIVTPKSESALSDINHCFKKRPRSAANRNMRSLKLPWLAENTLSRSEWIKAWCCLFYIIYNFCGLGLNVEGYRATMSRSIQPITENDFCCSLMTFQLEPTVISFVLSAYDRRWWTKLLFIQSWICCSYSHESAVHTVMNLLFTTDADTRFARDTWVQKHNKIQNTANTTHPVLNYYGVVYSWIAITVFSVSLCVWRAEAGGNVAVETNIDQRKSISI